MKGYTGSVECQCADLQRKSWGQGRVEMGSIQPESLYSGHMGANSSATKWIDRRTHYSSIVTEAKVVVQRIKVCTHQIADVCVMKRTLVIAPFRLWGVVGDYEKRPNNLSIGDRTGFLAN